MKRRTFFRSLAALAGLGAVKPLALLARRETNFQHLFKWGAVRPMRFVGVDNAYNDNMNKTIIAMWCHQGGEWQAIQRWEDQGILSPIVQPSNHAP